MKQKSIIIYDFDGTLTPYSLPRFKILEHCGVDSIGFIKIAKEKSKSENINLYLSIYETYFDIIKSNGFTLTDDNFCLGTNDIEYNKGVEEFLKFLCKNKIKNYLLSSGIKVFLDKIEIAPLFSEIYATTFKYNDGVACGINYLMSDKNKVDSIKQIIRNNGNNVDDCSNVIYIGDGLTDFYAMKYVKDNGGISVFVYNNKNKKDIDAMKYKDVVSFFVKSDFSYGSELCNYILKLCDIN